MTCRALAPVIRFVATALASCLGASLLLTGCAAPSDPTPPHPVIPTTVSDLAARQSGNSVALNFTMPAQSTEHQPLAEMPAVEIDRVSLSPGAVPGRDTAWRQIYTVPAERLDSYVTAGRFDLRDVLSQQELSRPPGSVLAYRVRTRASKRRASANSNVVTLAIYLAPPAPGDLHASVMETAIELSWTGPQLPPDVTVAGYRVYRTVGRAMSKPGEGGTVPTGPALDSGLELAGAVAMPVFRDTHFMFGQTYVYIVRAITQYGAITVESENSPSVTVVARDIFPPIEPTGLEAAVVPGGNPPVNNLPATTRGPLRVELSWAISSEPDLAGYRVYRSEDAGSMGEPVSGSALLPTPAFRDDSIKPGGHYFYRVSAVDQAGNESALSNAIEVDVAQDAP